MTNVNILNSVARQYGVSLAMLRQTIDTCHHVVYYTNFYLQPARNAINIGTPWVRPG